MTDANDVRAARQRLDDAVHEYAAALSEDEGWDRGSVAGWAVVYQEQIPVDDVDLDSVAWRGGYCLSPGLSEFTAVGFADYLTNTIRRLAFDSVLGGDDDGDT